jgi:predicted dehydrogenase
MSDIKVAIVGAGSMAREHIKAFKAVQGVKVIGINSRTLSKAESLAKEFGIPKVIYNLNNLYTETKADIVVIAVNILAMFEVADEVVKYPWLCLFEKPVGLHYDESVRINNLSKLHHAKCFVGLNRRHYSSTRATLSDLELLDDTRVVNVFDQEDPYIAFNEDKQPQIVVDNWMYANSIHMIDYFRVFCRGKITSVTPLVHWDEKNPSLVVSKIEFSSGDIGIYQAVWNCPGPWAVTITTHTKRWEMRPLEQASFQLHGTRIIEQVPIHEWDSEFKAGFRLQAEETLKALQGLPHNLPTLEDSLETMSLIKAIYEI